MINHTAGRLLDVIFLGNHYTHTHSESGPSSTSPRLDDDRDGRGKKEPQGRRVDRTRGLDHSSESFEKKTTRTSIE